MRLIVILIVELVCAGLCAWIWRANARPAWVGAVLGFLFGIAAIVISLLVFMTGNRRRRTAGAV